MLEPSVARLRDGPTSGVASSSLGAARVVADGRRPGARLSQAAMALTMFPAPTLSWARTRAVASEKGPRCPSEDVTRTGGLFCRTSAMEGSRNAVRDPI